MYKITKKYEDFLGRDHEESFRFNINESEMLDMVRDDPSFNPDYLLTLTQEPNGNGLKLIDVIRKLLVLSYGEMSDDGKRFIKDDDKTLDFIHSRAYEEILHDFIDGEHPDLVKDFMLNVFPKKYKEEVEKRGVDNIIAQAK